MIVRTQKCGRRCIPNKDLPYSYRKGEKRFRAKHVRRDGKAECLRQLA